MSQILGLLPVAELAKEPADDGPPIPLDKFRERGHVARPARTMRAASGSRPETGSGRIARAVIGSPTVLLSLRERTLTNVLSRSERSTLRPRPPRWAAARGTCSPARRGSRR